MSEETKALIRKYNGNIEIGGLGTIFFGTWEILKFFISIVMESTSSNEVLLDLKNAPTEAERVIYIVLLGLICLVVITLHLYVGVTAIRFARKRSKKARFLLGAVILSIYSLLVIISYITTFDITKIEESYIVSLIVEITFASMIIDMIYSYIRIKMFERQKELGA